MTVDVEFVTELMRRIEARQIALAEFGTAFQRDFGSPLDDRFHGLPLSEKIAAAQQICKCLRERLEEGGVLLSRGRQLAAEFPSEMRDSADRMLEADSQLAATLRQGKQYVLAEEAMLAQWSQAIALGIEVPVGHC